MKEPATLREALENYKTGKFLRKDMIGRLVSEVETLQGRIGGVDEDAVNDLRSRISALEITIGNALNGAQNSLGRLDGPRFGVSASGIVTPVAPEKRKPGRPPKAEVREVV